MKLLNENVTTTYHYDDSGHLRETVTKHVKSYSYASNSEMQKHAILMKAQGYDNCESCDRVNIGSFEEPKYVYTCNWYACDTKEFK